LVKLGVGEPIFRGDATGSSFSLDPSEEGCFDGADRHPPFGDVDQEVADVFGDVGGDLVEFGSAPDADEEEHLPRTNVVGFEKSGDAGKLLDVLSHHGGVDLHSKSHLDQCVEGIEGAFEVSGHPPNSVVGLGVVSIEGDGDGTNAPLVESGETLSAEFVGDRRREGEAYAPLSSVVDEVLQVPSTKAVAPGQDDDRRGVSHGGDVVEKATPFFEAQFSGSGV
jgi:hypothetical protein